MRKLLLLLLLGQGLQSVAQQTFTRPFFSETLREERTLRIHLPRDHRPENTYPLLLVLDGDYFFYPVVGAAEVLTTTGYMPPSVVVGIDQNYPAAKGTYARWLDCDYNTTSGMPEKKGILFRKFILDELMPALKKDYGAGPFRAILGHSFTANYVNYFLTDSLGFRAFGAVSPYLAEPLRDSLPVMLNRRQTDCYYFLSTAKRDLRIHREMLLEQDSEIFRTVSNPALLYRFRYYDEETHMTLTVRSAPDILRHFFAAYAPLFSLEDTTLLEPADPLASLKERYEHIKTVYGIEMKIREDDLLEASAAIEEKKNWEQLEALGRFTVELYPNGTYGFYMLGQVFEERGQLELALEHYRAGYERVPEEVSNKADFYEDIQRVEQLLRSGQN